MSVNSAGPGNGRGAGNRACSSHARLMANDCTGWNRDTSRASIGPDYPDLPRAGALRVSPAFCECAGDQRSIVRGNRLAFVRVYVRQGQSR